MTDDTEDHLPDPYSFCGNCGKKHCPGVRTTAEGLVVIDEDVADALKAGNRVGIAFDRERATDLWRWLGRWLEERA